MRAVARLLEEMRQAGVVTACAVFGATAQMRYTEPVATFDVDVLVLVPDTDRLDVLGPLCDFCRRRGHEPQGEAIRVGEWPVQLVPAWDTLTREAVEQADTVDYEGVPLRVVRASHLAVIALGVGRAKDHARILALLESGSVTAPDIAGLAARHGLEQSWLRFAARFLDG